MQIFELAANVHNVDFVINSFEGFSYFGIFFVSIFVSLVFPLPEAVALLLFGFLGAVTDLNIFAIFFATMAGLIFGNNSLYRLSYMGSRFVKRFHSKLKKNKLVKYEHLVSDNAFKTVYFLRLVAGVRFFGPVVCGTLAVSWKKFFWSDLGATMINTSIFMLLGYFFHQRLIYLIVEVEVVRNVLLFFSAFILGMMIRFFSKKDKVKNIF